MVMCQVLGSACNIHQTNPLAYSRNKSCSTSPSNLFLLSFFSSIPLSPLPLFLI